MSQVKVFVTDRRTEGQTDEWVLMSPAFAKGGGQYAISQLRIVRLGLHSVTYLDVGNFCNKSTETTLHDICEEVFLRFSDSSKPTLIYAN